MPLRSLFSRNKKQSNSSSSNFDSNPPSSVNGSSDTNVIYSGLAASSSKLRLPFARKPSYTPSQSKSHDIPLASPLPRSSVSSTISDVGGPSTRKVSRSHPPPSKSAYFTAYAESAAVLSTQSLPDDSVIPSFSSFSFPTSEPIPSQPTTISAKTSSSGLFPWSISFTKVRAKVKGKEKDNSVNPAAAPAVAPNPYPSPKSSNSFNLKSFRHIRAPSPPIPIIPAHPRSGSNASDSSQRISVAAFREVHARRSVTGSPAPSTEPEISPRAPGHAQPHDPGVIHSANPSRSTPNLRGRGAAPGRAPRRPTAPVGASQRAGMGTGPRLPLVDFTDPDTDEDESGTSDDDDQDFPASTTASNRTPGQMANNREHTAVKYKPKARSEMDHSYSSRPTPIRPTPRRGGALAYATRAVSAYGFEPENAMVQNPPRSQSSLGVYGAGSTGNRLRASASTSALVTNEGISRSSVIADSRSASPRPIFRRTPSHSSTATSSNASSSDDDDAPLASLVGSRGPGSAMSHGSSRPRKPLIDITGLTLPILPPSKGVTSSDYNGPPQPFRSPITRPSGDKNPGPIKEDAKPREGKGKEKETNSVVTSPGNNLSERLARILQEDNNGVGVNDTNPAIRVSANSPIEVTRRAHHRRASSDGHVKSGLRDSGNGQLSGAGWVLVNQEDNVVRKRLSKNEGEGRIVPTPIRQRDPPSSFSVTSRPQHPNAGTGGLSSSALLASDSASPSSPGPQQPRQRSTTLVSPRSVGAGVTNVPDSPSVQPRQRSSTLIPYPPTPAPVKPFAGRQRGSPTSSTGDSSSGRAPLTPRDGSDLGVIGKPSAGAGREPGRGTGVSADKGKGRGHRSSANFEGDGGGERDRQNVERDNFDEETRRRERRRSEARAAIELGNVVNGPGPILDDEENDRAQTINFGSRMSMLNPMMAMNMGMRGPMSMGIPVSFGQPGPSPVWGPGGWSQQQQSPQQMTMQVPTLPAAQFMIPPPADPSLFAAHQQAMLFAKQAYQMAVAQQALVAAGEEWERGSTVGGFGGTGSVLGGGQGTVGGMGLGVGWATQQQMFAAGPRAAFSSFSGAQSDYGGGGTGNESRGVRWSSSKSVYGESFGPSGEQERLRLQKALQPGRESGYFAGGGPTSPPPYAELVKGSRSRATSGPARVVPRPKKPTTPPSSWRSGCEV